MKNSWTHLHPTTKSRNSEQTSLCARYSEHYWKFWTLTENFEQILNIDWTESEHYWKFWTLTENSEHSEQSLNRFWLFWTLTENSEQILNILSKYIMWYFFLNQITTDMLFHFSLNLSFSLFQFFFLNQYILLHFH
jgi:hypothetical protein